MEAHLGVGPDLISTVRRFNRTVTQRIGALDDTYLARGRPLAQARLLWEIGPDAAEVAALRARLGLDAGYLSRLLRALEADGLITVAPAAGDGRVRTATLTGAGQAEWTALDQRSDELAESILRPLDDPQRDRLVTAMRDVERLLMASMITIEPCPPSDPRARACLRAYVREIAARFDDGFEPTRSLAVRDDELVPPAGLFLLASLSSEPVGCGAIKLHPRAPAEIKRLWVSGAVRGMGVGKRILTGLERHAAERGWQTVRLDTNRNLYEAIGLYRAAGYREVERYNDEPYAHHWFAKSLTGDDPEGSATS